MYSTTCYDADIKRYQAAFQLAKHPNMLSTVQLSATFCPMSPASATSANAQWLQSVAGNGHACVSTMLASTGALHHTVTVIYIMFAEM
jgi:hypothetical protein